MKITETNFGSGYHLITLENKAGLKISLTDLGARITRLMLQDRDLILGFDSAEEYLTKDPYSGATVGPTAGRIQDGKFTLDGKNYQLAVDQFGHNLHGGQPGFERKKWSYKILDGENEASVLFTTTRPANEHGFPGNLELEVRHTLTRDNMWRVTTRGVSDEKTLFNPTNHAYFNLSGDPSETIHQHKLFLNANTFAPVTTAGVTQGLQADVSQTPFDFQTEKKLAEVFASDFPQKELFDGIDHPFFLKQKGLRHLQAKLTSPDEKISLELYTDRPAIVVFTGNFGSDTILTRGKKARHHSAIALETQFAPGAERYPSFGSIVLPADFPKETITEFKINQLKEF